MTFDDFKAKHKENVLKGFDGIDGRDYWAEFKADLHTLLAHERKPLELQIREFEQLKTDFIACCQQLKDAERLNGEVERLVGLCNRREITPDELFGKVYVLFNAEKPVSEVLKEEAEALLDPKSPGWDAGAERLLKDLKDRKDSDKRNHEGEKK